MIEKQTVVGEKGNLFFLVMNLLTVINPKKKCHDSHEL